MGTQVQVNSRNWLINTNNLNDLNDAIIQRKQLFAKNELKQLLFLYFYIFMGQRKSCLFVH